MCGDKMAMIAHLVGKDVCQHACEAAKKVARCLKNSQLRAENLPSDANDESDIPTVGGRKRKEIF